MKAAAVPFVYGITLPIILFTILSIASCGGSSSEANVARHKRLAGELKDNKLYTAAVEEYCKVLSNSSVNDETRGNINYLIGKIYYENIRDYEQAAAYYVRAKALAPSGSFVVQASKNLVACLEKMGRMLDARRYLENQTDIDSEPREAGDLPVARIGEKTIWLSEIEERIQSLPTEVQKRFVDRAEKIKFVHNYVGVELMYHAALRENYQDNPDIRRRKELLEKELLVDKYVLDKVMPRVTIDSLDVRNFYSANKSTRYNDAPYDSVRVQLFLDYQSEKTEAAYRDYISTLARAEKVVFLDHNIK